MHIRKHAQTQGTAMAKLTKAQSVASVRNVLYSYKKKIESVMYDTDKLLPEAQAIVDDYRSDNGIIQNLMKKALDENSSFFEDMDTSLLLQYAQTCYELNTLFDLKAPNLPKITAITEEEKQDIDAISGAASSLTKEILINMHDVDFMLKILGPYGDPRIKNAPIISSGTFSNYDITITKKTRTAATFYHMGKYAETDSFGGGIMPGPLSMMATGAAFEGSLELTLFRRKGSNAIAGWLLAIMMADRETQGIFQTFSMQIINDKKVAESILKANPDLLKEGLTKAQPSRFQKFKEKLFNIFYVGSSK